MNIFTGISLYPGVEIRLPRHLSVVQGHRSTWTPGGLCGKDHLHLKYLKIQHITMATV